MLARLDSRVTVSQPCQPCGSPEPGRGLSSAQHHSWPPLLTLVIAQTVSLTDAYHLAGSRTVRITCNTVSVCTTGCAVVQGGCLALPLEEGLGVQWGCRAHFCVRVRLHQLLVEVVGRPITDSSTAVQH